MLSFKQKNAGNTSSLFSLPDFFFFLEIYLFILVSSYLSLVQTRVIWKSPSVLGNGFTMERSVIFRSYNDVVHGHYLTDILPVTLDYNSNTNAAAATLLSFLLVNVILAVTGSENLELNLTLTLYVSWGSITKDSSDSSVNSGDPSSIT